MKQVQPIMMGFFVLSILLIPTSQGLTCYECYKNLKGRTCEAFQKASEDEKRTRFLKTCNSTANGCYYFFIKIQLDDTVPIFEDEHRSCHEPTESKTQYKYDTKNKMNTCLKRECGQSVIKICACNTGDFCTVNEEDDDNYNNQSSRVELMGGGDGGGGRGVVVKMPRQVGAVAVAMPVRLVEGRLEVVVLALASLAVLNWIL